MRVRNPAMILTATLGLAGSAIAGQAPKTSGQIIAVQIQSEPLRVSASQRKPGVTLHANTRMSATVAQINSDGTLTLNCESQHMNLPAQQQLQMNPR